MSVKNAVLIAAILGSAMGFIDSTAVNVVLPVIQRELGATAAQLQWIVEGYALFLSALILTGGALGDRFGHRRTFAIGIVIFALASALCAASPTIGIAIVGRCVQGIGAALFVPESLALISQNFSGAERGKAFGIWSASSAITAALGPVLGGWLAGAFSWRYVFVINLPLAVFVVVLLLLRVPESRSNERRPIDLTGASLATIGLGALIFALIEVQGRQLDLHDTLIAIAGIVILAIFAAYEWFIARYPMLDHRLFASSSFVGANLYTLLLYAALSGSLYFVPFDLINVHGYTPFYAGLSLLPFVGIMSAASSYSGTLVSKIGARIPLAAGAAVAMLSFLLFARIGPDGSYWTTFFPAAVVLGCAGALFVAPLTTVVMSSVDSNDAGIASGVNNAASRVAGLIAIAALGYVVVSISHGALTGAAFHRGFGVEMTISAGMCAVAAVLALAWRWQDLRE